MQIEICVRDKIARIKNKHDFAICGNSDYTIKFDFDGEWNEYNTKTARFKWNGSYTDVVFNGSECPMPIITNAFRVEIGVYAGQLHTTSSALLPLKKSILCGNEAESKMSEEIGKNIDKLLDEKISNPQIASIGEVLIVDAVNENGKPIKWNTSPMTAKQKQVDWEQSDSTAVDYIKNKPFYTTYEHRTFTMDGYYGNCIPVSVDEGCIKFTEGEIVEITIDGETISMPAKSCEMDGYSYTYIGDSEDEVKNGTGAYKWRYMCYPYPGINMIELYRDGTTNQRTVTVQVQTHHPLELKYSPIKIRSNARVLYDDGSYSDYETMEEDVDKLVISNNLNNVSGLRLYKQMEDGHVTLNFHSGSNDDRTKTMTYYSLSPITYKISNTDINSVIKKNLSKTQYGKMLYDVIWTTNTRPGVRIEVGIFNINDCDYRCTLTLNNECLSGCFVTKEGWLYTVVIDFNNSDSNKRYDQDWTLILKRVI